VNSTASLGVHVSGGVATLTGAVRTAAARAKTVAAARSVKGITEVVDQLRVDPTCRTSDSVWAPPGNS